MFFFHPTRAHAHAMGRRGGFKHWGQHGGFWGFSEGGMPGGRRLSASDLQLLLLALLEQRPAHGYELIRDIEQRSGGFYTPSPGVIYPALTYLDEIGHASIEPAGNRKLYSITDAGRQHLEANRGSADAILDALQRIGGRMEQVREAFAGMDDAGEAPDVHGARKALKQALAAKRHCAPEEARRIAAILKRAAEDILGQ
ncbi:PadR family transcriptional regulator [Pigmentiphaga soli]|uniref:PadR family transcriptional regulator n=1 Tax=Pigmentiphaga soli TaxID=1007095 RepID=A0ABP8GL06_9BURK